MILSLSKGVSAVRTTKISTKHLSRACQQNHYDVTGTNTRTAKLHVCKLCGGKRKRQQLNRK
jgi:hypothetical protein